MTWKTPFPRQFGAAHAKTSESPAEEDRRLAELVSLDLLDTPPESQFDDLAHLASEICQTPVGMISFIDDHRQWIKASVGFSLKQLPREAAFCAHTIRQSSTLIVEDAQMDGRFTQSPLVTGETRFRFYAGVPLRLGYGLALGTLCVMDTKPRMPTKAQIKALEALGRQAEAQMELRAHGKALEHSLFENVQLSLKLQESTATFLAFMDHGPFMSYLKDAQGRMLFYNAQMADTFGVTREEWIGRSDHDIWPAEVADAFRDADTSVLEWHKAIETVEVAPMPDGTIAHWKSYKFPIQNEQGEWLLAGISMNISDELEREATLQAAVATSHLNRELESNRLLMKGFLDNSPNHAFIKDARGRYISYNADFAEYFGIGDQDWIGLTDHDVLPREVADMARLQQRQVLREQLRTEMCGEIYALGRTPEIFHTVMFPLRDAEGAPLIGGVAINIMQEVERQQSLIAANMKLQRLADGDSLTGLYNRRVFYERTAAEFAQSEDDGRPLSVVVIDVDDFKRLNDRFGHSAGDEALRLIGTRLRESVRPQDVVARLGGEEFGILFPDTDLATAQTRAGHIRASLAKIEVPSGRITVSLGLSTRNSGTDTPERLITQADDAMYQAKRSGKDRVVAYIDSLPSRIKESAA